MSSLLLSGCLGLRGPEASAGSDRWIDPRSLPSSDSRAVAELWPLHKIDTPELLLPNGLDEADVDADGLPDYVTNYEWSGRIRVAFHPEPGAERRPWPAATVGRVSNAESVAFGDFDGDGRPDIAVAHGREVLFGSPGVRILWGPPPSRARDPAAWRNGGDLPASRGGGHYHYIKTRDLTGDGRPDIVVGGRVGRVPAGLRWFEAPGDAVPARKLKNWKLHVIDPELESGHGFVFGDLDGDGDEDIALANSDWDTFDADERVLWYENPGPAAPGQSEPWPKHELYRGPEFYTKEQVDIGDLDGDGRMDLVVQTIRDVLWFRNLGGSPVRWERIAIPKDPAAQWRARPIRIVDLDGDGRREILGMLIHWNGWLPADKAACFVMRFRGFAAGRDNWETRVLKWGDGFRGLGAFNGEKWDQLLFRDVDDDGDVDIVANCEEYHRGSSVLLAVVWFENPRQ
jgi:hypothetical protein